MIPTNHTEAKAAREKAKNIVDGWFFRSYISDKFYRGLLMVDIEKALLEARNQAIDQAILVCNASRSYDGYHNMGGIVERLESLKEPQGKAEK